MEDREAEPCSILVADDDVELCASLKDVLLEDGSYDVDVVHSGKSALAACRAKAYEVLMLDVGLPDVSGTEILEQVEQIAPELEVLVITGDATLDSAVKAVSPSTVGYLVKPLDFDRLFKLLAGIRRRQLTRRENRRLVAHLEEKYAELERYAYTVSHDLKSPLLTISGFIHLIERDALKGDVATLRHDVEHVVKAVRHMAQLLDDLLELSRTGRATSAVEAVPLDVLTREVLELLARQIADRGVEVVVLESLPAVRADRVRLRQVLQNLVDNAVKFLGDQAAPRVEIGAHQRDGQCLVYVRDNGIGIAPHYLESVFGLFNQLDPSIGGTGLGLALSRRIVESLGGRLWGESEGLGRGTCFYLTLPSAP